MSKINDALKRAQKKSPSAVAGPQLRPVEPSQLANRTLSLMVPVLLIFAVAIGAFFLWEAFQNPARNPQQVRAKMVAPENPIPQPQIVEQPVQKVAPQPIQKIAQQPIQKVVQQPVQKVVQPTVQKIVQQPVQKVVQQPVRPVLMAAVSIPKPKVAAPKPAPVSAPAQSPVTASAPIPAPEPAPIVVPPPPSPVRLQAIFYSPGHSTAIINGKTLSVGETLKEYRVIAITPSSATLISTTVTNVLKLSEQ